MKGILCAVGQVICLVYGIVRTKGLILIQTGNPYLEILPRIELIVRRNRICGIETAPVRVNRRMCMTYAYIAHRVIPVHEIQVIHIV